MSPAIDIHGIIAADSRSLPDRWKALLPKAGLLYDFIGHLKSGEGNVTEEQLKLVAELLDLSYDMLFHIRMKELQTRIEACDEVTRLIDV
jgi:cytosine/adenosine deaminase-related metal-dependent hydrolase